MITFIAGPAGSGKTKRINDILAADSSERRAIFVVPEQASFEKERELYELLGARASLRVEVLSTTRLATMIFREYGGLSRQELTTPHALLLLYEAISELSDSLRVYGGRERDESFLEALLGTINTLKFDNITPTDLWDACAKLDEGAFAGQVGDIALVYEAYNALVRRSFADPTEDVLRAAQLAREHRFFECYDVYFDDFATFTAVEYEMISAVMNSAHNVYFTLCTDAFEVGGNPYYLFRPTINTYLRLFVLAHDEGCQLAPAQVLLGSHRYHNDELCHLEQHLLRHEPDEWEGVPDHIHLYKADSRADEIARIAAEVKRLVREEGLRYRDIAVVFRRSDAYRDELESVFARYGIPLFMDSSETLLDKPLVLLLLSALTIAHRGFDTDTVLSLLKTDLLPVEPRLAAQLQSYCYTWRIAGRSWTTPFTGNPRGAVPDRRDEDVALLAALEGVRQTIVDPLERFRAACRSESVERVFEAFYQLLDDWNIEQTITARCDALREVGDEQGEFLEIKVWELVGDTIELFARHMSGRVLPPDTIATLLTMLLSQQALLVIPQSRDSVTVGDIDRMRLGERRVTFVAGLVDGAFPMQLGDSGLLDDSSRRKLQDVGIEWSGDLDDAVTMELFFVYIALTRSMEKLYLSYPSFDDAGESLEPSIVVDEVRKLFPQLTEESSSTTDWRTRVESPDTLIEQLILNDIDPEPFAAQIGAADELSRKLFWASHRELSLRDSDTVRRLFGSRLRLSPTSLRRYFECPFSFYCASGLSLRKPRRAELGALQRGELVHHLLERIFATYTFVEVEQMGRAQLRRTVTELAEQYVRDRFTDTAVLTPRFLTLIRRVAAEITALLMLFVQEMRDSDYTIEDVELSIDPTGPVPPLTLHGADDVSLSLHGVIDRVDMLRRDGDKLVRVVDYKSGSQGFLLSDVYFGHNLQMFIYLFSIWKGGRERYSGAMPAGVMYVQTRLTPLNLSREATAEHIAREREKALRSEGLQLSAPGLEARSGLRPATLGELTRLYERIETLLTQMADEVYAGHLPAKPVQAAGRRMSPCETCDYGAVCGYKGACAQLPRLKDDEVLTLLREGDVADV